MIIAEQQALLQDIINDPDNDIPRLIYADWLEDNKKYKEADSLRFDLQNPNNDIVHSNPFFGIESITKRRGFPESVVCNLNAWIDQGPQLVRNHPITKVRLTDRQPEKVNYFDAGRGGNINRYYWFPNHAEYPLRHRLTNPIHNWMINNECGRKSNCWDSEDKAWYALILWAKAENRLGVEIDYVPKLFEHPF